MGRPKKIKTEEKEIKKPIKKKEKVDKGPNLLQEFIEVSGNEWADIADNGIESGDITGFIDTGSYAFNALCSGSIYQGVPDNKIFMIAGEESTGKSFWILSMVKTFLDANPTGVIVLFETEGGLTKKMLVDRGMDPKRIGVFPVETVQQWNNQALKIMNKYLENDVDFRKSHPMLMVLDSLGMISTDKEMEDIASGSGKTDMTRAKLLKAAFRTLTLKGSRAGAAILVTNHTYDEQSAMFPQKIVSGGKGGKYAASTTVIVSKAQEKEGDERVGNILTCTLKKGRLTREGLKVKVSLRYDTGLNRYYGLIPIAEEAGIFKKDGTKYKLPGDILAKESSINNNPEKYYTKEILDQIDAACHTKFLFGNSKELLEYPIDIEGDGEDGE